MKKLLLILAIASTIPAVAMQRETQYFERMPSELRKMVVENLISSASNLEGAIKSIRETFQHPQFAFLLKEADLSKIITRLVDRWGDWANNEYEIARRLAENASEPLKLAVNNWLDKYSKLQEAIDKKDITVVKQYISENIMPLDFIIKRSRPEVKDFLVQAGLQSSVFKALEDEKLFDKALSARDRDTHNAMLKAGYDINAHNYLQYAANDRSLEMINYLVQLGANVNNANKAGMTPLMSAANKSRNADVIKRLIELGANLNAKDNEGMTAAMYTLESNNIEGFKALKAAGADLSIKDKYGKTVIDQIQERARFGEAYWLKALE